MKTLSVLIYLLEKQSPADKKFEYSCHKPLMVEMHDSSLSGGQFDYHRAYDRLAHWVWWPCGPRCMNMSPPEEHFTKHSPAFYLTLKSYCVHWQLFLLIGR